MKKLNVSLIFLIFTLLFFIQDVKSQVIENLTTCTNISTNNSYYVLNTSINNNTASLTCMNITAYNVILDCQNNYINGSAFFNLSTNYGIYAQSLATTNRNITISNCNITNMYYGIFFQNINNSFFYNTSTLSKGAGGSGASKYRYGLYLLTSHNNIIENYTSFHTNPALSVGGIAGIFMSGSSNNNISNSFIKNMNSNGALANGIYIDGAAGTKNIITNVTIIGSAGSTGGFGFYTSGLGNNIFNNITASGSYTNFGLSSTNLNNITNSSISNNVAMGTYADIKNTGTSTINYYQNILSNNTPTRINFDSSTPIFSYANDTTNLWLKTQLSGSGNILRANIFNWTASNITFNESSASSITATYNISDLIPLSYYSVYNFSILAYDNLPVDSLGKLQFNITLNTTYRLISLKNISDVVPPTYINFNSNTTNNTLVNTSQPINISSQWSDNSLIDKCVNSSKNGVKWVNGTWVSNSTDGWVNFTIQLPITSGYVFLTKIYCNDTLGNTNVTGTFQWINISAPLPAYSGSSQIIDVSEFLTGWCENNITIRYNTTYNNESVEVIKQCQYGCDSKLNSCNPNPLEANLWTMGIIGGIIFLGVVFMRKIR